VEAHVLLSIDDGAFNVLVTTGDTHLSSEDLAHCVIDYFIKQYKKKMGTDVSSNMRAMGKPEREAGDCLRRQSEP